MKNFVFAAVAMALVLGALGAVLSVRLLVRMVTRRLRVSPRSVRLGAIIGGSLALLPSFLFAIAEGGSFAAGWLDFAGEVGVLIGAMAGIAMVFGLGLAGGAAIGLLGAALAARLVGSARAL